MDNEAQTTQIQDDNANIGAAEAHPKPMLTVDQQIAHMKAKGITFDLVSEAEAAAHLRTKCQFFRVYAYRRNFDRHVGGDRDGQYVGLDFGHLRVLSNLDRKLRDTLLPMALDLEHFAKVRLLAAAEDAGEDGYAVMRGYMASVTDKQRSHLERELDRREDDPYAGDVVRKYRHDMPLWAFCEVVSFGAFLGILRFCADRWGDRELSDLHYHLKWVKSIRNASAHGSCAVNDLSERPSRRWRAPDAVTRALASCGVPKRLRAKRLRSPRMAQMCTLLYLYDRTVPEGTVRTDRERALADLFGYLHGEGACLPSENPAVSSLTFAERLTRGLGLID